MAAGEITTTLATRDPQDGLAWDEQLFDSVPVWTKQPSEAAIKRTCCKHFGLPDNEPTCTISFFSSGAFNKLYLVTARHEKALMRVSLPVYPTFKTRGEVTTLRWVKENTSIPVPRVLAFDDTNNNDIGFEWILMELMPGKTAYRNWRAISMEQKKFLAETIADYQAQLARAAARHGLDAIGTLSKNEASTNGRPEITSAEPRIVPSRLVTHEFFLGNRLKLDVPHGPFRSSQEWITTLLDMIVREQTNIANEIADDEDSDKEEAEEIIEVAKRLLRVLPKVFPEQKSQKDSDNAISTTERTYLYHDDLNLKNILLDKDGDISAIVDWECVSALPLWMSTRMPQFLRDDERWEEPNPDQYAPDNEDSRIPGEPSGDGEDALDNEGKADLYWIHRGEYEATVLGKAYREKLGELWLGWEKLREEGFLKVYMYEAVLSCASGFFLSGISRWIDAIEAGTVVRDGKVLSWVDA
ncbi:phosphotransferase enzyme family-domain-containing protein [Microdochium trichocladiopsis]|uniref:Phosphotransferase enzyme family-domain-containing protein n=1 Tax=Microdochium trichocladiopsis TaxID=1682393 RepID=A0A9P9BUX2_9PEZI|nr:phosphotransferase enzyme family-domain-containing protein [Microdochium trichocladiopsis]KAH7041426.1 phosphotransferase enzyme family-domain-containing protein [Microdochium trichocladiopsis]